MNPTVSIRIAIYGEAPFIDEGYDSILKCATGNESGGLGKSLHLDFQLIFGESYGLPPQRVSRFNPPGEGEFGYDAGFHLNLDLTNAEDLARRLSVQFPHLAFVLTFLNSGKRDFGGVGYLQGREFDRCVHLVQTSDPRSRNWPRSSPGRILIGIEEDLADRMTEVLNG